MLLKKAMAVLGVMIFAFCLSSADLLSQLKGKSQNKAHTAGEAKLGQKIYTLCPGEEFVYGKIGLFDDGQLKYTLAVIRKPSSEKPIYEANFDPYASRPVGEPVMKLNNNPRAYEKYDFWLIFNGRKFGPYDRILDMTQNDPDIDNWVSRDGKHISFCGVKGQKYYPIINNQAYVSFWTTGQAPSYDARSGKSTNSIEWSQANFRLYENGPKVLDGWKSIKQITYSEDGTKLMYVGARDNRNEKYVYVNHEKIAGPYYLASKAGFIPGTNKVYCAGFNIHNNYKQVILGDKRVDIPDGSGVTNFHVNENKIVFTIETRVPEMSAKYGALARKFTVMEYDVKTGNISRHGEYWKTLNVHEFNGSFYYETLSKDEEFLYLTYGGRWLAKKKVKDGPAFILYARDVVTPDGTLYLAYRKAKPDGNIEKARKFTYVITKNGVKVAEYDAVFAERARLNESNGEPFFVFYLDQAVGALDRMFYYGGSEIRSDGYVMETVCAPESLNVYSIVRTGDTRRRVYKNGKPADELIRDGVTEVVVSGDGSIYAALVSNTLKSYSEYYTTPAHLDAGWKLVVNGNVRPGNFGAPIWSFACQSLIALEQKGADIVITSL